MHIGINGWGELCTLCGREGHYADDCPRGNSYRETDSVPAPIAPIVPEIGPSDIAPDDLDEWYPEC